LSGAIEADQSEDGKKWILNNRLIGVATQAQGGMGRSLLE